jgi:RimJ/RimL family protein N-acetyltransferase
VKSFFLINSNWFDSADVAVENKASWKLLEKAGFKKEGLKRKSARTKSTGKWHDTYSFGLLRSDVKL